MKFLSLFAFVYLLDICNLNAQSKSQHFIEDFNRAEKKFSLVYRPGKTERLNYSKGDYAEALSLFFNLYNQEQTNMNLAFKLGICYLNSQKERAEAIYYLGTAITSVSERSKESSYKEKKAPLAAYYYLGEAYHLNYQFDKAIEEYEKFISLSTLKSNEAMVAEAKRKIEISKTAKRMIEHPVKVRIVNMGPAINSAYADYSPVLSADQLTLFFTSRRPSSMGGEKDAEGNYMEDIYTSVKTENGWSKAESISDSINTNAHEATVGISPDGQNILIYKDDSGDGNIYTTTLEGEVWRAPVKLNGNINSKYWDPSASISADGNTLYFSSNRPGGYGGRDLYTSKRTPKGDWAIPVNMGAVINTPYDEDAPFISADGNFLSFSSNGHATMGGFDIFTSHFSEDEKWSKPENVGSPINTTDDDIYYVVSPNGLNAYFSSFRKDGFGEKDIYIATFPRKEIPLTLLKGVVKDKQGVPVKNVEIKVLDEETEQVVGMYRANNETGKYLLMLPPGKMYNITYSSNGYLFHAANINVPKESDYHEIKQVIVMDSVVDRKEFPVTLIKGAVTDKSGKPAHNVQITIADNETQEVLGVYRTNEKDGKYLFMLSPGKDYNITYQSDGYLFQSENLKIKKEKEPKFNEIKKQVILDTMVADSKITLENIFFDFDKATLRPLSNVEINNLVKIMNQYPNMKVEISGHTDNIGNNAYNQKLSERRAQAVVKRLIKKGISKDRMMAKGYGEERPITINKKGKRKNNSMRRQLNRRVEFKITDIK